SQITQMGREEDKPVVEKIGEVGSKASGVFAQWWSLTTSDRRPKPVPERACTIDQLPIYPCDLPQTEYKFIPEEPLPLQREFATVRVSFLREYERVASRFSIVDSAVNKTTDAAMKVNRYVNEEWTVLPKAAAITVGGMAGFVLGLKRGSFGRLLTSSLGLVTMAAFCYPHEAVDVVRTGIAHSEQAWEGFKESPNPSEVKKVTKDALTPPK
ncbi:moma-1, partial [Pristionchus pacificus]